MALVLTLLNYLEKINVGPICLGYLVLNSGKYVIYIYIYYKYL